MNKQTVDVVLRLPEKFHRVVKHVADLQDETVEGCILRHLIVGLEGDLSLTAGEQMHPLIESGGEYQDQLAELAGVEA